MNVPREAPRGSHWWWLIAIVLAYACAFQGSRPIYSPDEGRYTIVALNMLDSGDWTRPMLHPEVEHWSKPPLTYWAVAASMGVFGRNEFAARLPNALAFAGTLFLLLWIGRRFTPQRAWLPALVYATFVFPSVAANIVTTDTLLALWETLQLAAFVWLWWAADARAERHARLLLWLAAALAFMTKGPPGLLILAGCVAFAIWEGRWRGFARVCRWDGLLLFLVVGGAWYVDVAIREPQVLRYFLVEEVVNRVASDKMHRHEAWYGGFKVYLPTLLVGSLPWLPLFTWFVWRTRRQGAPLIGNRRALRLLLCCIVLPLTVFMLARSRLPLYLLPLFAPLAVLTALALQPLRFEAGWSRTLLALWCLLIVGARVVPAHLEVAEDDRRLAEAMLRELPLPPHGVLFVETAPRFGLRLYLGSSIERLTLPEREALPQSESIESEMGETSEGCRVLLMNPADIASTQEALVAAHVRYQRLADVRGYAMFVEIAADCAAYATL
ncbi:MAG: glycosyltransferase family 39 protein [Dokdonella sp.]